MYRFGTNRRPENEQPPSNLAAACCVQIYTLNAQSICAQYGRICTSPIDMSADDLSAPDRRERATVIQFIVWSRFARCPCLRFSPSMKPLIFCEQAGARF